MGLPFSSSPIIPIKGPVEKLQSLSTSLREKGLLGPVIHPPSVPEGMECIRISVTNHWDDSIIEQLAESVKNAGVLP
jgi:7-keto-8-aminopelargonate synthetase-like enzyme